MIDARRDPEKLPLRSMLTIPLLGLLLGCGATSVQVSGSYPIPNVEKLPLRVAVYYDDALRDFSYTEFTETGQEEFHIQSGQSHIELFNSLLPGMFDYVTVVNSIEDADPALVDVVFEPTIEEFQLALPYKTKLNVYEVWIKYNMRLQTAEGDYIADWVATSYGKTETQTFRSNEASINEAAVEALRDLATSFTFTFATVPEVRDWLASR